MMKKRTFTREEKLRIIKDAEHKVLYIYDATGVKLKKQVVSGADTPDRYYAGAFEYDDNKELELIHTEEGVINVTGSTYDYEYFLKDHLGNTRVTFKPDGNSLTLLQKVDYYPFGMVADKTNGESDNKYLYNGKELQDEIDLDWYDYGARFYDPQIGRFTTADPLSQFSSPYNYVGNNPIKSIDPTGLWSVTFTDPDDIAAVCAAYGIGQGGSNQSSSPNGADSDPEDDPNKKQNSSSSQNGQTANNSSSNNTDPDQYGSTVNEKLLNPDLWIDWILSEGAFTPSPGTIEVGFHNTPIVWVTPGGQFKSIRFVLKSWKNVNFSSIAASIRYHFGRHVVTPGIEKNIFQFTDDALNFFKNNSTLGKDIILKDGSTGLKITTPGGGPGGIFTKEGKIISFWYR